MMTKTTPKIEVPEIQDTEKARKVFKNVYCVFIRIAQRMLDEARTATCVYVKTHFENCAIIEDCSRNEDGLYQLTVESCDGAKYNVFFNYQTKEITSDKKQPATANDRLLKMS